MEKIVIDKSKCIGCGLCVHNHPEYLVFDEMGLAEPLGKEIPETEKNNFLETVEQCPTEAFMIEEENNNFLNTKEECPTETFISEETKEELDLDQAA